MGTLAGNCRCPLPISWGVTARCCLPTHMPIFAFVRNRAKCWMCFYRRKLIEKDGWKVVKSSSRRLPLEYQIDGVMLLRCGMQILICHVCSFAAAISYELFHGFFRGRDFMKWNDEN